MDKEHSTWFTKLPYFGLAINTTVNISTFQMLFILMHGDKARLPIDLALGTSDDIIL